MRQIIYAAIGIEEGDGIITIGHSPEVLLPVVCMDKELLPWVEGVAAEVSKISGKEIVVGKFELSEVIERFGGREM